MPSSLSVSVACHCPLRTSTDLAGARVRVCACSRNGAAGLQGRVWRELGVRYSAEGEQDKAHQHDVEGWERKRYTLAPRQ